MVILLCEVPLNKDTERERRGREREATAAVSTFARLGTDYEIRNQWFFTILEAMTTDLDLS